MQIMRIGPTGRELPAVRDSDGVLYELSPITREVDGAFLAGGGTARVREALASGALSRLPAEPGRIGAPIGRPGAVVCIGQNYAAHAAESGDPVPTRPIVFLKPPNTVVGPFDEVLVPRRSTKTDWEVELGVVIGRQTRYLEEPAAALEHVAGYVVSNDVSERTFQLAESGGQWSKGKAAETFNPVGPWFVPAEEVDDPQMLGLRSWVNGEPRQDSSTKDMIFSVAELLWHLSQYMVLEAGDLVNTGTPQGVALSGRFPYLRAGDVVEMEIDGLGRQRQVLGQA